MASKNIELRKPKTENPTEKGTSSSEFETFKMNEINSLVREEIQNSLDVVNAEGNDGTTIIDFCFYNMRLKDLPRYEDYRQMFRDNQEYWKTEVSDNKTKTFFENIEKAFKAETIRCLRISDYNNTGLSQERIGGRFSPWKSMLFGDGVSDKASGSGGSHGLGKNASYTNSILRTVIYETVNREGNHLMMGVVKAPSYRKDNKFYDGYAFLCDKDSEGYEPVDIIGIDKNFNRAGRIGTDKHILGCASNETVEELEKKIALATINNFFVALQRGKLVVNCNNHLTISKDTIDELMEKYKDDPELDKSSYNQYQTIKNPDKVMQITLFEKDDAICYFRENPEGTRCIGVVRSTGMKIYNQKGFPSGVLFDGVILIVGKPANDFFKSFENGEHNAWKMSDIKANPEYKKYYDTLFAPVRNIIKERQESLCGDAIDIEGVGEFLPDAYVETKKTLSKNKSSKKKDVLSGEIESAKKTIAKKTKRAKVERTYVILDEDGEERIETHETSSTYSSCGNRDNHTKGRDGIETPVAETSETGFGIKTPNSQLDPSEKYFAIGKKVDSKEFSVKLRSHGHGFKMAISSKKDIKEGFIEVKISGETMSGIAQIKSVTIDGKTANISKSKDKFKIENICALTNKEITIDIDNPEKLAVEVYLYENTRK